MIRIPATIRKIDAKNSADDQQQPKTGCENPNKAGFHDASEHGRPSPRYKPDKGTRVKDR